MVTKEQERKALTKIEAILKELGDDSYVGMAMEGMIADAKENIDNDWACSWKQRAEKAASDFAAVKEEAEQYKEAYEAEVIRRQNAEAKVLSTQENALIQNLMTRYRNIMAEHKADAEGTILDYCNDVKSDMFRNAVDTRNYASVAIKEAEKMIEVLDRQIRPIY